VIQGYQEALYLMYRNLIDNAIRYTPTGGQVTVSLDNLQPSKLTVTVSDTGSGIPLKRMARVFERFYRGANQNIQGSGLGLSIVQRVAQLHHVEIQLDNAQGLSVQTDFLYESDSDARFDFRQ
jgi:signal transduction histidine kinase